MSMFSTFLWNHFPQTFTNSAQRDQVRPELGQWAAGWGDNQCRPVPLAGTQAPPLQFPSSQTAVLTPSRGQGYKRVHRLVRMAHVLDLTAHSWLTVFSCFLMAQNSLDQITCVSKCRADQLGPTDTVVSVRRDGDMLGIVHSPTSQDSHYQLTLWP